MQLRSPSAPVRRKFNSQLAFDPGVRPVTAIGYVNAIPGAGKTHEFIKLAVEHVLKRHRSVLVYAGISKALIMQVYNDLYTALLAAGVDDSDKYIARILADEAEGRVADRFRVALNGSRKFSKRSVPDGTILLVTHECIARSPHDMHGKDRVVLVYDEARACLEETVPLRLPAEVYAYLIDTEVPCKTDAGNIILSSRISESRPIKYEGDAATEKLVVWDWMHPAPFPGFHEIDALLPQGLSSKVRKNMADRILAFLENVYSSSIDVYVSVKEEMKDGTDKAEYVVNSVASPIRMFTGYAKVLILSAFFETSQMYHFLKESPLRDSQEKLILTNFTNSYINPKRVEKLLMRLANTIVVPLLDLKGRSLTKTEMRNAIVLDDAFSDEQAQKLAQKWKDHFGSRRPASYRSVLEEIERKRGGANIVTLNDRTPETSILEEALGDAISHSSVIFNLVERAVRIQQAWFRKRKIPQEELPVGVNARLDPYSDKDISVWKREQLSLINLRNKQWEVDDQTGKIIVPLSMNCHGINLYENHRSAAFLATMLYSIEQRKFLQRVIPRYNPELDRTLDYALQVLFRCNVRRPHKDNPQCLLIVTDMELAMGLQRRFREYARRLINDGLIDCSESDGFEDMGMEPERILGVVNPEGLFRNYKQPVILQYVRPYDPEAQRDYNQKRKGTAARKLNSQLNSYWKSNTESGAAYNRLSKEATKHPERAEELKAERKNLRPTYGEWRRSEAGQQALERIVRNARPPRADSGRSTYDKLVAAFSDRRMWDGNHSGHDLFMIEAAKAHGLQPEEVSRYYPGDGFMKNWNSVRKWEGKKGKPANVILADAKKRSVRF